MADVTDEAIISSLLFTVSNQAILLRLAERKHKNGKQEAAPCNSQTAWTPTKKV